MIKLKQAVIVEGKYDKIKLSSVIDGVILQTDGFRIFKDKQKRALIKKLAHSVGIVILTDSDAAGFTIRNFVKSVAGGGDITNVYIPQIFGKEKRKSQPSKEGTLGVEGVSETVLLQALNKAGIGSTDLLSSDHPITKMDFYLDGLTGGENSTTKRAQLLQALDLPHYLSANALLEIINLLIDYDEYKHLIQ